MKKHTLKKIYWFIAAWLLLGPVHHLLAVEGTGEPSVVSGSGSGVQGVHALTNPLKWDDINSLLNGILDAVLEVGMVVSVIMIIFAGLKLVLAQGNPEKIDDAKHMFYYTIIGIAVLFGAKIIASVITATVNNLKG